MFKVRSYQLAIPNVELSAPLRIALVADLHNNPGDEIIRIIEKNRPDMIAVVGDLMVGFRSDPFMQTSVRNTNAFDFLRHASGIAPTFYSLGNHEKHMPDDYIVPILRSGAILLDNAGLDVTLPCGTINIGGVSSCPDLEWLKVFSQQKDFKLLLCHHPEYYPQHIRDTSIDVVLSGHTHGGQWRIGNQGIYAPGQGLFPRYSGGVYDDRLVISRGLANTAPVPRFGNPRELVFVEIKPN